MKIGISFFYILIMNICLSYAEDRQTERLDTLNSTISTDSVTDNFSETSMDSIISTDSVLIDEEEQIISGEIEEDSLPPIEKMPELKEFVEAKYPEELIKQGIEGTVLMELIVNDSGKIDSAYILNGVHPTLDTNAMQAAEKFIFTPAIAGGVPVPVLIQYEYHFTLKDIVEQVEEYINFSGQILEGGTKLPLADAMVVVEFVDTVSDSTLPVPFSVYRENLGNLKNQYLEEDRLVTLTDSLGQFRFYSLPACTIFVSVPVSGYNSFEEREIISSDEETQVKYYVKRQRYSDYEIVVYGKKEKKEVSKRQLTLSEVRKIPGLGGDAIKVVQALPGVGRPTFGSGQVIVRGSPTWDSKFYLDGVIIPRLYHIGGIKSIYPTDALESVDFYPGGFGSRYGGAIAGVIEITSRKPKVERWQGQADLSLLDGFFLLEGPVTENVSILASTRRSFQGELLKFFIENSDLNLPYTISPFYWDYVARIDMEIDKRNYVYTSAFGSRDSMGLIIEGMGQGASNELGEETDRYKNKTTFHMGIVGWDFDINEKLSNSLRYAFTGFNSYTSVFGFAKWSNNFTKHHIREQLTYKNSDEITFNFGIDSYLLSLDLLLLLPNQKTIGGFEKDTSESWLLGDIGTYVNLEIKPNENILIIPSLRYDYYPELIHDGGIIPEFWNYKDFDNERGISGDPSFRMNGRYKFIPDHIAKFAIGTYNQTPQPMGQVIHETWGDPHLPTTKASHFVLGYEWQITDLIHLDLQGYLNRQWDIPRTAEATDADIDKLWYSNGKARMRGLEIMLRHDQGERFFGWISYSLSRSERWDFSERKFVLYGEDETNHFQFVGSWKLGRNWEMGTRIRYVTGKPETPIIGFIINENMGVNYMREPGKRNSVRKEPFFQIDYRIDKKIIFDKWIFSFYLDIQNLSYWIYKSPEMWLYSYDYSEKQMISNIFFPALGFKAEF